MLLPVTATATTTLEIDTAAAVTRSAARGRLWVRSSAVELHLGVETDFRPARKAHPAIRVADIDALGSRLTAAGYPVTWDELIAGTRRFFTRDPLGNRREFIAAA